MNLNKIYKTPISFKDLEEKDLSFEKINNEKYHDVIEHYKRTAELYISLFSNSKRLNRGESDIDFIQLVAIRIFQDTRAALILALKGLYPQSSSLLRGVLESYYLIYDFKINPQNENIWFDGSKNKRDNLFKFSEIKKRVDESNIIDTTPIKGLYKLLSNYSIHINQESHLWYMETKNSILYYHWAGYESDNKSESLMTSCLNSLAQGLFILTYEGLYALDQEWANDFTEWKKEHLEFMKKTANMLGLNGYEDLKIIKDKSTIV